MPCVSKLDSAATILATRQKSGGRRHTGRHLGLRPWPRERQPASKQRLDRTGKNTDENYGKHYKRNGDNGGPIGMAGRKPGKPDRGRVFTRAEGNIGKRFGRRRHRGACRELAGMRYSRDNSSE